MNYKSTRENPLARMPQHKDVQKQCVQVLGPIFLGAVGCLAGKAGAFLLTYFPQTFYVVRHVLLLREEENFAGCILVQLHAERFAHVVDWRIVVIFAKNADDMLLHIGPSIPQILRRRTGRRLFEIRLRNVGRLLSRTSGGTDK